MINLKVRSTVLRLSRRARLILLLLLVAALCMPMLADVTVADDAWDLLSRNHVATADWVRRNYPVAVALYLVIYLLGTSLSLPCAAWLTVGGGLLFGTVASTFYAVIGATAGATFVFILTRLVGGDLLRARAGSALQRVEEGFRRHNFSYLLFLRLLPIMPFWLVNIVPALLGVRLRTYVLTTAIGIIPGTALYAALGGGAAALLDEGIQPDADGLLLRPEILIPLGGLALLALMPALFGRARGNG